MTLGITNAYGMQSTVTGVQQKNLLGQSTLYGNTALIEQLNNLQNVGIPPALANTFMTASAIFPSNYTTAQISTIKNTLSAKGYTAKTVKDEEDTIFTAINAIIIVLDMLGMSSRRVFMLFSIEAVLIGSWGSILGVGFAALLGSAINAIAKHAFLKDFPGFSLLTYPWSTMVVVIVVIMFIAFLAGTLPALRASKKNPIDALRYE